MRKIFCYILCIISLSSNVFACENPRKTVSEYLRRDFRGERLSYNASDKIDKMEVGSRFEPAWDITTLTTGYEIKSVTERKDHAIAKILFKNTWEISGDQKFALEMRKDEIVEVHMLKVKGCWKISPPFYQPHVHPIPILKHFEEIIQDAKKSGEDNNYMHYIHSEMDNIRKYKNVMEMR